MPLQPGTRLGPYEIVAELGSGGMGEVYRALDARLDRFVAIKILSTELADDPSARARFEREAKAIAALSHPNIVAIHDVSIDGPNPYLVTELLEGETLRSVLQRGRLEWPEAVATAVSISKALQAAHARGIVHRDLKPENVFMTRGGVVKILDFGIAHQSLDPSSNANIASAPTEHFATAAGTVVGTLGYISPEQLRGERVTAASDIFSLGCLLYEMITGQAAFARDTAIASMSAVLTGSPSVPIPTLRSIPAGLAHLMERCIEKDPVHRVSSAAEVLLVLEALRDGRRPPRLRTGRKSRWKDRRLFSAIVGTAAVVSLLAFLISKDLIHLGRSEAGPRPAVRSLAILPFVNGNGDPDTEYLCDGITETLINSISQVTNLKVMSRTSVFTYKNKSFNPLTVGRELNVDALLVGRITRRGKKLLVSAELVDATDNTQIWGRQYSRDVADIFAVQEDIASELSRSLRRKLTGAEQLRLTKRYTDNPQAYDFYLKGRFEWNKRDAAGLQKAIRFFESAIAVDPSYALAYAGMADCYNLLDIWAGLPTRETFPKAKAAAEKAISLDGELAEAHNSLAYAIHSYEWDWVTAEREYKRAIELNPNYATARQWYSEFLTAMGRFEEAAVEGRHALDLDPISPIINAVVGWNYCMARRYPESIAQNRKTIDLFPDFMPGHAYLGLAHMESGNPRAAVVPLESAKRLLDIVVIRTWLLRARLGTGDRKGAQQGLAELEESGKREYLPPYYMAILHAHLGNKDRAFVFLEKAYQDRTGALVWLKVDPAMDVLRSDARFQKLMARIGF